MIQSSSKRLAKIKKKLKKNDASDYYFLISSLHRDSNKQNYASNQLNIKKASLKNSIQLKKSSMINSFDNYRHRLNDSIDNRQCSKIKMKSSGVPFFENVKFLKNSRVEQQQTEQAQDKLIVSKHGYQKNIQFSQNVKGKYMNQSGKDQKQNKFADNLSDSMEHKVEAYVQFVNELFQQFLKKICIENNSFARKRCLLQTLGKQLLRQVKRTPQISDITLKNINKSIQVSNFSSFPSKVLSRQLQRSRTVKQKPQQKGYKKVIEQLSHQNTKLTQLISQHERKNIKMFIKMNENQSHEIQWCKKYLSTLYDKYKLLEKSLIKENQKYNKVSEQKSQLQKKMVLLQNENHKLQSQLEKLNHMLDQIKNQTQSKLSLEDYSSNTLFNFNLNENQHNKPQMKPTKNKQFLGLHQNQNMDRSFITKREKASSCLSTHLNVDFKIKDAQIMSCSTITKTKNMKKKKPKQTVGINLKNHFNSTNQEEQANFKTQMNILKEKLNQQIVLKLALQKQLNNMQAALKKKTLKSQKMQVIIDEQISQMQKLVQINSKLSNDLKTSQSNNRPSSKKKTLKQVFHQINHLNHINDKLPIKGNNPSRAAILQSQYRIIAMQAGLLQDFINCS